MSETQTMYIEQIDAFRALSAEPEWLEFKRDNTNPQMIGEYLSALSNAAALSGKSHGHLLFGVDDATHEVVGTNFDPYVEKGSGNQDLLLWLSLGLEPRVNVEVLVAEHPDGRVVWLRVAAASERPVQFYGRAFVRVGSSKVALSAHPDKERALWSLRADWSAQPCNGATLDELDPAAITKAREQFTIKHPRQAVEIAGWDDATFLNKARVTVQGLVTNTAVLLLGRPEAAALLSPAVAKISWILKNDDNQELDYEHFGPPFILDVDLVLARIRNLTLRALPSGTLFPQEIQQYDPWVIREALHNCIAHQDYALRGRINVVETPSSIVLTNVGSFLPGDVERVIHQDAPTEVYRNPFLADAMVNLNMIDTQGGGIKRMFQAQARRFFPLPDFDLSDAGRVVVRIQGRILDEHYTRLLMQRTDLDLWQIMALDKVQKRGAISKDAHQKLKALGLVEGRYPQLLIAGPVARATGGQARHIRDRGFNKQYYLDLIVALVREHGPVSRSDINHLLLDKLPEVLNEKQRLAKIHNLLMELSTSQKLRNDGSRARPKWVVNPDSTE